MSSTTVTSEPCEAGKCVACGSQGLATRWPGFASCRRCGHVAAAEAFGTVDVEAIYGESYFRGEEYGDYELEREALEYNFRQRLASLGRAGISLQGALLLDVGCAFGYFAKLAQDAGAIAKGIDVSVAAVEFARTKLGIDAETTNIESLGGAEQFDVITMWDCIEHMQNPRSAIAAAHRLLRPGGWICFTTGDIGSLNARIRGRRWRMIHPPSHVHYFTGRSATLLLDSVGMGSVSVSHPGITRSVASISSWILERRLGMRAVHRWIADGWLGRITFGLNLGDIMLVIARKSVVE